MIDVILISVSSVRRSLVRHCPCTDR